MLAAAPACHQAYAEATPSLLAALPPVLNAPPLQLLSWTASLYLQPYLTAAERRAAMSAALHRARAEARSWGAAPAPLEEPRHAPFDTAGQRAALYGPLWRRALAANNGWHLVLAQHAVEISELLERPALRLGYVLPIDGHNAPPELPDGEPVLASGDALELLSRALLGYRIDRSGFIDRLLVLHAGVRGSELTGGWTAPWAMAARLIAGLPDCDRAPRRLRAAQPHELARRAVVSGSARAVLAVEAGLAEAEQLTNGRRLLLLAALDRALSASESDDDRH